METAPITMPAKLCAWRIFGMSRSFSDKPSNLDGWIASVPGGPKPGDVVKLTVGTIPVHILRGLREFRAHSMFALGFIVGNADAGKSPEETEQLLQTLTDEADDVEAEVRSTFPLWLTLELERNLVVKASREYRFRWVRDEIITVEMLKEFAEEANDHLDLAVVRLLPALGQQLRLDRVVLGRRCTYVAAEGKAVFGIPQVKASGSLQLSGAGWDDLPFSQLEAALGDVPSDGSSTARLVRAATRWLMAALAAEDDPLRRFQFAFFGLEILANKVGKYVEKSVVEQLTNELGGLPIEQLVWPTPKEADSPWRSLVFRFAILSVRVARSTAAQDIELFQKLTKSRNQLAHGNATVISTLSLHGRPSTCCNVTWAIQPLWASQMPTPR